MSRKDSESGSQFIMTTGFTDEICVCSDWWRNYGAEQYGPDSVCLLQKSAFVMEQCTKKMTYPDWGSGCYKVPLNPPRQFVDIFLAVCRHF